jgi:hypothetical protein
MGATVMSKQTLSVEADTAWVNSREEALCDDLLRYANSKDEGVPDDLAKAAVRCIRNLYRALYECEQTLESIRRLLGDG